MALSRRGALAGAQALRAGGRGASSASASSAGASTSAAELRDAGRVPIFAATAASQRHPRWAPVLADVSCTPVRVRGRGGGGLALVGSQDPSTSATRLAAFPSDCERVAVVRPAYALGAAAAPLAAALRPASADGSKGVVVPRQVGSHDASVGYGFVVDEYIRAGGGVGASSADTDDAAVASASSTGGANAGGAYADNGAGAGSQQSTAPTMELSQHAVPLLPYLRAAGVPVVEAELEEFERLSAKQERDERTAHPQSTNRVLMVAPTAFGFNAEAAADNYFMSDAEGSAAEAVTQRAMREHHALWQALCEAGVNVSLWSHGAKQGTPDALYPNNWFSTHAATGLAAGRTDAATLALYPMKPPNRRLERRADIVAFLAARYGRVVDFSPAEEGVLVQGGGDSDDDNRLSAPAFLEGTGSLVLDHINRVAYVAASERSDVELTEEWAAAMGFNEVVAFDATDADGRPIYHTNVVMAIGTSFAVVCTEAIADASQRERVLARLRSASKEVVQISRAQMGQFCGNVLELLDGRGRPILALSEAAHLGFTGEDRLTLSRHVADFVSVPIPTIESVGGGSVRCCIAELFP